MGRNKKTEISHKNGLGENKFSYKVDHEQRLTMEFNFESKNPMFGFYAFQTYSEHNIMEGNNYDRT